AMVEFIAGSGKIQSLVRDAFEAADAACRQAGETDFVTAMLDGPASWKDHLASVTLPDLREALTCLSQARESGYQPKDRMQRFDFEALRALFWRWLSGATLDATERRHLRVFGRIETGSMAVRVLTEMFSLARRCNVLHGMLLCMDELETLFGG